MRQILHLLIVDRDETAALATWQGPRWLLPVLTSAERVRAGPMVLRWAGALGINGDVAGQWLGRLALDATDWLMVIRASSQCFPPDLPLAWAPLDTLSSARPVIDYQGWAVGKSLERGFGPSMPGPFGRCTWIDEVKAWICGSTGSIPGVLTPYRVTAKEVVLGADTRRGRVYFKGLTGDRASEARLTGILAALAPSSFARTLALDARSDGSVWWLTAESRGTAAVDAAGVARALARLQRRVMASGPIVRELGRIDFEAAARWASGFVDGSRCAAAIGESMSRAATAAVPESWIPMDLDPGNVLVDGGEVRFIDLDDSFLGPAPLAMAVFARRCRDRSLYRVYEDAWSLPLAGMDWPGFEVTAAVLEAWLGWQRLTRNVERGHVHGAIDFAAARIRDRLARFIVDRSPCRARRAGHAG